MRHATSPAESFLTHGLQGINLHHVSEQRARAVIQHRDARAVQSTQTGPIRHHLGQLLIGLGQTIAGCQAARPQRARLA